MTTLAEQGLLWVIEVTWKRRKSRPVEAIAITTGGTLQALLLADETAKRLKIPQAWVQPVLYRRFEKKQGKEEAA